MKITMSWLNDYTDVSGISPKEYADCMTMSGSKVETVEEIGGRIQKVVTGKILSIVPHPDADKLVVCQVNVGAEEPIQIVTAAKNMKENDIVPVALHGSVLADGTKIKKGKLRGVLSQGMFCSHEELGLTPADLGYEPEYGILILKPDTKIGVDITKVFPMEADTVVDFEITSNRPDCFSVIGLARETAVTFDKPFSIHKPVFHENDENVEDYAKVTVLAPELCPRYAARVIKNVKIGPSPAWMVRRLQALGLRSINNIVDITNYIMLEYGQPMHAFDLRDIEGKHITVRTAKDGETITTLDGNDRTLDSSMLVISDDKRAVAVAGVMGAENSEVKDDTTDILFECATFAPASVRITAKKLGLRTDASSKYEKGLDVNNVVPALNRACELAEQLSGGQVVGGMIDVCAPIPPQPAIDFRPQSISNFLGIHINEDFMVDILKKLECQVDLRKMTVTPPSFRPDLKLQADLAEEVLRFYGYDKIESTLITGPAVRGHRPPAHRLWRRMKNVAVACGLDEIITFSFTNPNIFDKLDFENDSEQRKCIEIRNPLGVENSVMRTTSLGSMMEILAKNYKQRNPEAKLFEQAKVYVPTTENELPLEQEMLSMGMYGESVDFYTLKGAIEEIFLAVGIKNYRFEPFSEMLTFHPGRCAMIYIDDDLCGIAGEVHPMVTKNFEIGTRCYMAELSFDIIKKYATFNRQYKPMPKYPAVTRDLSLLIDDGVWAVDITNVISKNGGNILDNIKLFDVYKGKQIPENKRSMAYSITFRADDRTLTDDEINPVMDKIITALESELHAQLR